jgi:hypothetical protein
MRNIGWRERELEKRESGKTGCSGASGDACSGQGLAIIRRLGGLGFRVGGPYYTLLLNFRALLLDFVALLLDLEHY